MKFAMASETTVVHVTHEAVGKIGGIGAVLQGLFTCQSYLEAVGRSIIISPLFTTDGSVLDRLGEDGEVLYSSIDGLIKAGYAPAFRKIEALYNVGIVYGMRKVSDACTDRSVEAEVLLVDVFHFNNERLNLFKAELFRKFAVPSDRFEDVWEFEQYIRLAEPGYEALKAIGYLE